MKFNRFEHVNQLCQNLDVTRQFYQTLFPEWYVRAEGEEDGWKWMHFGDRQFYLSLNQSLDSFTVSHSMGHLDHIGFVIENSEQMKALLDKNRIDYSIYISPETKCRIYVNDPDGTQVELVEYNPSYELK